MKRQIILPFVFVFTSFAALHAQQTVPGRQVSAAETMKQRQGEVLDFQKLLRRYETAIKENDVASAADLKSDLLAAMQKRIALLEADQSKDVEHLRELRQQRKIYQSAQQFSFEGKDGDFKKALDHLSQLRQFAVLMRGNFITQ